MATEGIDPDSVDWRAEINSSVTDAIIESVAEYDLLVVGESEPSLTERILGDVIDEVIDQSTNPLSIVRDA